MKGAVREDCSLSGVVDGAGNGAREEPVRGGRARVRRFIERRSPVGLFLSLGAVIFAAELLIMFLMSFFPGVSSNVKALVDAALLLVLVSPVAYVVILRPLLQQIEYRIEMLSELKDKKAVTDALLQSTHEVLKSREFKTAARAIFDKCRETIGARAGYVSILNADGSQNEVLFLDSGGRLSGDDPELSKPVCSLRDKAYSLGKTVYENGFTASGRAGDMPEGWGAPDNVMFAPLVYGGMTHGIIGLADKKGGFTDEDARVATAFGELAALSLRNVRTFELYESSERRLFRFLETLPVGVFVVDALGKPMFANAVAERILDWNTGQGELLGEVTDVFNAYVAGTGEKYPIEKLPLVRALAGQSTFVNDIEIRNARGRVPVEAFGYPIRDEKGDIIYAVTAIMDISGRKEAERALRQSEERFRRVFEQNHDAIIMFDSGMSRIADANREAEKLFGCSRGELLSGGARLIDMGSLAARIKRTSPAQGDVSTSAHRVVRDTIFTVDGQERIVDVLWQTVELMDGEFLYCSFRDVTEKIRLKEEAEERQAQLIHASKMASIGALVSGIAHEIGNPNNYILLNIELLQNFWRDALGILEQYYGSHGEFTLGGLPFSEVRQASPRLLSGISEGSYTIKNKLRELMEYVRMDKSDIRGWADVKEAVDAAVSILSSQVARYTDKLIVRHEDKLPPVKGSSQKLKQAVINLLMNSLEALPDRKHGVFVSTSFDAEHGLVVIIIRDEGVGMPGEVLERAVEPFFTTKFDTRGIGLGLYIAQSIIKEHGAELTFESEHGRGTTATIKLPTAGGA